MWCILKISTDVGPRIWVIIFESVNRIPTICYGEGQGTGSVGTTWDFHSIPMMRVIEKTCSDCVMSSPNKMYKLIKHILGYVDDKW